MTYQPKTETREILLKRYLIKHEDFGKMTCKQVSKIYLYNSDSWIRSNWQRFLVRSVQKNNYHGI